MENEELTTQPQSSKAWMAWVIGIVAVILVGGGLYYYYEYIKIPELNNKIDNLQTQIDQLNAQAEESTDETADWKTYTNDYYSFSFKYPEDGNISVDNLNATTTIINGKRKLSINVGDDKIVILGNFEGGFENAAYFYWLKINDAKLDITKKEKSDSADTGDYITSTVLNISSSKSLYIQYFYSAGELDSALNSFDTILSTFQFTDQ